MKLGVFGLGLMALVIQEGAQPQTESVWWWFSTCGGPMMTIEVKAQGTTVASALVPLCRAARRSPGSQGGSATIVFSFRPHQPIVWTGDRDEAGHTAAVEDIVASLWEASADRDALMIGLGFGTHDRTILNTIHVAHPNRRDESTIAPGLTVVTYPSR